MDTVRPTASGVVGDALAAAGHYLPLPCRGRHTCGKCGVYVAGALAPPDPVEADLLHRTSAPALPGYEFRLACLARLTGEASVIVSSIAGVAVAGARADLAVYDGDDPDGLGVAVDIGTTTVTVLAFRLGDHAVLADVSQLNHQSVHGADVLSRIDAAGRVGVGALRDLIVGQLDAMIAEALARAGVSPAAVRRITITGNTTMLHLLTGRPVASLGRSPFTPDTLFGYGLAAGELFPRLGAAELYLPPAISAYVGPDIVCGLLATGLGESGSPELLIDVGTNGEMALAAGGRLWCCATAAGPAFEGAEISAGMPALPGAIDDVWADDAARGEPPLAYSTIGRVRAKGLCGTGLIAAVDALLRMGIIDDTGAMAPPGVTLGDSRIGLTPADVRQLQLAKAAIAAGVDTLLHEAGLTPADVAVLHLAGGFGSYLAPGPAAGIGLIPAALAERATPAGNTALSGAALLATSAASRRHAEALAARATEVPLATHPVFLDRYIEDMAFRSDDDG